MKCERYHLDDVCTFIDYRGKTPPKTTNGIPLITAKIIKSGAIQEPQEFIAENYYDEWMRRGIPKKGAVVFTTEAPLGEVARIRTNDKLAFAQRVIILEANKQYLSSDYLFYALQDRVLKSRIEARSTGTTVIGIKAAELRKVEIDLPPLQEQQQIAEILCSLDDKIDLNNKINANLQQQAQAIFKSWFVNFEPFQDGEFVESELGPIPKGWRVGTLSELVAVKYGKDHKKLTDGPYPVYGSGGIMRYVERPIYTKESVLIPRKGTLNNVIYLNEPFWSVDTMFYTEMKMENVAKYVYHFVSGKDLASMNSGSAVPSMTTDILNSMKVVIPTAEWLAKFEQILLPLYSQMFQNAAQSKTLAQLRDTLLPKLMNGGIEATPYAGINTCILA